MRLFGLFGIPLVLVIFYVNYFQSTDGQISIYTRREMEAIKNFRPMVSKHLTQDFMKRDGYLLRFLRHYDFDFEKAARRLESDATYRKENNIDGILNEDLRAHAKYLPFQVGGHDRKGYPFFSIQWGKWDLRKYILAGKGDIIVRCMQQIFEKSFQEIWTTADKTGKDIDQKSFIGDIGDFNVRQHLCLECAALTLKTTAAFDGISSVFVKKVWIINGPRVALPIINLMKSTYPFPPVSLTTVYDNVDVWKKELLKDISPDQLPKMYGGTREG